ncbi:MAG: pilin [Arenicella sp.]
MNQTTSKGFTLIELMIVISIIGILASISLPAYQTYTARAQVSESLSIVSELKSSVAEYYKIKGNFPVDNSAAGIPAAQLLQGNFVNQIKLENGAFHVKLGNKINQNVAGKIVTIRPIVVKGSPASPFSWVCGYSQAPEAMRAVGENQTSVEKQFLPAVCRF